MDKMSHGSKKAFYVIGGIAAVVVVGKLLNDRNGWFNKIVKSTEKSSIALNPMSTKVRSIGDIGQFDGEDSNYCGNCVSLCDEGYSGHHSTQCDLCRAGCPGVRRD